MTGLGLAFADSVDAAAVRRPTFSVRFGDGGGSGGGGLLGAVAAAVGLTGGANDPWQGHLVSLALDLGLAPCADLATLVLAGGGQAPTVAAGDSGSISLGYTDQSPVLVCSATVAAIRRGLGGALQFAAENGGGKLSRLRLNQSYEQQSAGDIVHDLAEQAGVETDSIESGSGFAFYVIDDRRSAFGHIAELARKCGFGAWFSAEGKLNFAPLPGGEPVQRFTYGADILALTLRQAPAYPAGFSLGGEGQDAWPWLVKDPAGVTAQAGDGARRISDPSLRSAEAAQAAADGHMAAAALTTVTGRIRVPGAPAVTVGSRIAITGAPDADLNGAALVVRVRHQFSKSGGFISIFDFSKSAESGAGPGGLL
jgi:phage protein D